MLQDVTSSVRPLLQRFNGNPDYPEDLIVNRERALELLDDNTTVIMVDVNRPSYTECPELLNRAKEYCCPGSSPPVQRDGEESDAFLYRALMLPPPARW